MEKEDLDYKDWGRIYAYMWLQDRVGNSRYKNLLETDPVRAVTEIIQALNKEYPALRIKYAPNVGAVCEVIDPPPGLASNTKLEEYRDGKRPARLRLRLVC